MIIGDAFSKLFEGLTVDITTDAGIVNRAVQYHYGDHKELIKWISLRNQGNQPKYPIVWYVIAPFVEHNGWYEANSRLVILTDTRLEWLNTTRNVKKYNGIINPVWKAVEKLLKQSPYIEILGNTNDKFNQKDEPNYGVSIDDVRLSQNDFSSTKKVGEKGISLDLVDGRVISFTFRIKANCIN